MPILLVNDYEVGMLTMRLILASTLLQHELDTCLGVRFVKVGYVPTNQSHI